MRRPQSGGECGPRYNRFGMQHPMRFILMGAFFILWGFLTWGTGFWFRGKRVRDLRAKAAAVVIAGTGFLMLGWALLVTWRVL